MSDPLFTEAGTELVQWGWTAFHVTAQHPPRDTKADSDAKTSHSCLKKAI